MKNGPKCHAEPFACHSERSEESLSFHAQGRLREASRTGLKSMRGILRFAQNDNIRQFFMSPLVSSRVSPTWEAFHEVFRRLFSIGNDGRHTGG